MKIKRSMGLVLGLFLCGSFLYSSLLSAEESGLEALKKVMEVSKVKIEHKEGVAEATATQPPNKSEEFKFIAGAVNPIVRYSRYLNQPPLFTGKYPSLPIYDMGIGFDGGSFGNWYRGNAIRVLINGKDIFAEQSATKVEWKEGENGYLRFIWDLKENRSLTLNMTVPDNGHAIYAKIDLSLPGLRVESVQVKLNCYPGGYNPAYSLPSHRWVSTAKNSAEVPKEMVKDFPMVPFTSGEEWIFYADKLASKGSLSLLVLPEEGPSGEVGMSNYGQGTTLNYPVETRKIHLGFYAFDFENEPAKKLFLNSLPKEREILKSIPFWPEEK